MSNFVYLQIWRSFKSIKISIIIGSEGIKYIYETKAIENNDLASSYAKQTEIGNGSLRN